VLLENHAAAADEGRGVCSGLPCRFARARDIADNGGQRQFLGEAIEFFAIAVEKCGALDEILREIAAEAHLREDDDIRTAIARSRCSVENSGGVAGEIADGGIQLAKRYFHSGT
jgi:hypothetical protein